MEKEEEIIDVLKRFGVYNEAGSLCLHPSNIKGIAKSIIERLEKRRE